MKQASGRSLAFWADAQRGRFYWHFNDAAIGVYALGNGPATTVPLDPETAAAVDQFLTGPPDPQLLRDHLVQLVRAIVGPQAVIPYGSEAHELVLSSLIVLPWAMIERVGEALRAQAESMGTVEPAKRGKRATGGTRRAKG